MNVNNFQFTRKLFTTYFWTSLGYTLKILLQIILPMILLVEPFDNIIIKHMAAINVVIWSLDTMLVISKWPGKYLLRTQSSLRNFVPKYLRKCRDTNFVR